ncbi:Ig-like domain-containing protein [Fimbriiglobus ruber]|uniref:Fibronectin type III domain protein n=1 Tax=Fimbriiglobus ruber TaxID=1908690 RepID=A0A225D4X9_9BACT|nr:Ig-like domain-containing protein [Fimbriiglobus ruber]OWK36651.1 Fibronectin type III domain protein [Fimbriiglobus ruber]
MIFKTLELADLVYVFLGLHVRPKRGTSRRPARGPGPRLTFCPWGYELEDRSLPSSPASIATIEAYIADAQLPNGAIRGSVEPSALPPGNPPPSVSVYEVNSYYSALAVSGLLAAPPEGIDRFGVAQRYFNWFLANPTPQNYWYDINGNPYTSLPTTPPDAVDSYAATFLTAVWDYYKAGGPGSFFTAAVELQLEATADEITALQQSNGLTWADASSATGMVSDLEDNSEVFNGLEAIANIDIYIYNNQSESDIYSAAATSVKIGICKFLYNNNNIYDWSLNAPSTLTTWYPDTQAQVWPIINGVIDPTSAIATGVMNQVDAAVDGLSGLGWTARTDASAFDYAAVLTGKLPQASGSYAVVAQTPYPTQTPIPDIQPNDVGVTTTADSGFMLKALTPAANSDSATTTYGSPVSIDVTANDYDIATPSADLTVSLPTVALPGVIVLPTGGTATVQPNGSILYTPAAGFVGTDTFTYQVADSNGATSLGTVSVTVTPAVTTTAASPTSAPFSSSDQSVPLSATVTSGVGTVNEGTETFTLLNGATAIGTPVTVNVTAGTASANYLLPASTAPGSYTIEAVYNGSTHFLGASDTTHVLTVNNPPIPTVTGVSPASGSTAGGPWSTSPGPTWAGPRPSTSAGSRAPSRPTPRP